MRARVLTDLDDLQRLAEAWSALADGAGARVFAHPRWCLPWWRHLGRGRPLVVAVEDGGDLLAVGPFHERRIGGFPVVRFLGHGLGAVSQVVVAPGRTDAAREVWAAVVGRGIRMAELVEYDDGGGGLAELEALPAARRTIEARDVCPFVTIDGSAEEWWAGANSELRRVLRRADRELERRGEGAEVEVVSDPARVEEVLPELVQVTGAAEAGNPRAHLLAGEEGPFTRDLFLGAAAADRLRLFVCRIGGRPASFAAMLAGGPVLTMWFNRFDPAYGKASPGHLTLRAATDHAFASGGRFREIDLSIGAPRYKQLWCTSSYGTLTVHAAPSPAALRAGRAVLATAASARTAVGRARGAVRS